MPATLEEADGGDDLTVDGTVEKTRQPRLKVGCRVKGGRVIHKVLAAATGVPVRVTFATP